MRRPRIILAALACMLLFTQATAHAQCPPANIPLNTGESVNYDLYFKWGVIMSRAGEATISYNATRFRGNDARRYRMIFRTIKIFESIYRMRDTLDCYYTPEGALLYSVKRSNENDYRLTDELTFYYPAKTRTTIRSRRYTPTETKIDTTLYVRSGCAFDMLGATYFLRTLPRASLRAGDVFPAVIAVGRDLVKVNLRYHGPDVVEHGKARYRTHRFSIDIHDDAFTQTRSAAELWVGADDNFVPIKIRAKLKIGYAEVYFRSASRLKAPLTCRTEVK